MKKRIIFTIVIIAFIAIQFPLWGMVIGRGIGAVNAARCPLYYPNSTYSTTDGSIRFTVYEDGTEYFTYSGEKTEYPHPSVLSTISGTIEKNGEEHQFFILVDEGLLSFNFISIQISKIQETGVEFSDIYSEYLLIELEIDYKSKTHFVGKVINGNLFEKGTVFDFYKVN